MAEWMHLAMPLAIVAPVAAMLVVGLRVLLADRHPSEAFAYRTVTVGLAVSLLASALYVGSRPEGPKAAG